MSKHNRHENNGKSEKEWITVKAYDLWQKDGCKEGRDVEYWLTAEKAVKGQARS